MAFEASDLQNVTKLHAIAEKINAHRWVLSTKNGALRVRYAKPC
jgi:hypothetical protein